MLDNNLKIVKEETKAYPILPENIYQVQLLDITSSTNESWNSKNGKTEEKEYETIFSFQFTLLAGKMKNEDDKEEDLRGRNVWANFIPSYLYISKKNGKNKLYGIIEAFLGRDLTPQEEAEGISGEFINDLVGKQCRIGTKNTTKDGTTYTNIETYYPAEQDIPSLTDEEKEKATVKKDKEEEKAYTDVKEKAKDEGFNVDEVEDVEEVKIEDLNY